MYNENELPFLSVQFSLFYITWCEETLYCDQNFVFKQSKKPLRLVVSYTENWY